MTDTAWSGILEALAAQIGIRGAFIFDSEGMLQAATAGETTFGFDLEVSGRAFDRILTGLSSQSHGKFMDLDLVYHDGRVLLRTFEGGFLAILCDRQVNLPLLTLSIEDAVRHLRQPGGKSSGWGPDAETEDETQVLIQIARAELGQHASKVIELLEAARGSTESLSAAIDRAQKITRLFIDRQKADDMARKMRAALFSRKI
jgi:predicted regulator of Ras-like GTPase activity (Roadblock/LC7/MglB family)